jgi:hypothetical protein
MISKIILKRAIQESLKADVLRGKIGAVLFTDAEHIICSAHNSTFLGSTRFRTIHAEEALLNKAFKISASERYGSDLNVLVVRYKQGPKELANAKPCPNCQRVLAKTKFKVFYSNINKEIVQL